MAIVYPDPSRTFGEFLILPNLTLKECTPDRVSLRAPVARYTGSPEDVDKSPLTVNAPIASALMQSVSDDRLAVALARSGGISFIFPSQTIESQADMIKQVKHHKPGFVISDSNVPPDATLGDVLAVTERTGHSTVAVTHDGSPRGKLVGIITGRDYRVDRQSVDTPIRELMTPFASTRCGRVGCELSEANDLLWEYKLNCLPIIDEEHYLHALVFRKDHEAHRSYPIENVDAEKRLIVGAGINSRDYRDRVPALLEAGADILCIDSSDGHSEWQKETIEYVKKEFGSTAYVGAGNVVDKEGFEYLARAGADFVKVGIGGGSICITREQKGIGRGQASAVLEVSKARDAYLKDTGEYVPICSDGGITQDYHMTLALAMGADFIMLGRYFARFDEAPGRKLNINNNFVKEYWGEGSNRARNWQRYDMGGTSDKKRMDFEEGVDSYVPYAGKLKDNLDITLAKIRSTMCNCGVLDLAALKKQTRITVASSLSMREGAAHDVMLKETNTHLGDRYN